MKLEYVILAVLMAAAAVTAVVYFGQTLNQQTAIAAQATAGRSTRATAIAQAASRETTSSRKILGARDEDDHPDRTAAAASESARESMRSHEPDAARERDAESMLAKRRTTLHANEAAQARKASQDDPSHTNATSGNLLWIILVVLIAGGGLVYMLSSRLRT
ncbi:MAG: hypothetical protein V1929_07165 [bacterium]